MSTNLDTLRKGYIDAYNLMICNLLDADSAIRVEAIENNCFDQLMEIRDELVNRMTIERETISNMADPAFNAFVGNDAAGTPSNLD